MIKEREFLKKYQIDPINICYKNNSKIITTEDGKYTIKVRRNNKDIYNYLRSHAFNNFLSPLTTIDDPYEIYPYIESKSMSNSSDKAVSLVYHLSLLHTKTTVYEEINLDKIKALYEKTSLELNNLDDYYHDLHDYIENKVYMSPEEYLLIRNITLIYNAIIFSKENLKAWYDKKIAMKKERQVFLHRNPSLKNFIMTPEHHYFINWDNSSLGVPLYDLLTFFKNDYEELELKSLYNIYQSKYRFTEEEELLFFTLLSKPWKLEFTKNHYNNTLQVQKLLDYIVKGSTIASKEDQEDQET